MQDRNHTVFADPWFARVAQIGRVATGHGTQKTATDPENFSSWSFGQNSLSQSRLVR